ncbi:retrovirus-related pol polyprotein from transposon TNT 1-94 [Tanacetum coccineum]
MDKDHPLEQVCGNPSKLVQTRRQLATDHGMCIFALTVSTVEPTNIKEEVDDSAWIEIIHDELHQFDRLQVWELVNKPLLKQAPRAWYDELSNFLMSKGFTKGTIDPTLFTIRYGEDILLVQIYVDDIIFGSTNPKYSKRFEKLMHSRFEMSLMGEMKFFLGLQIHQSPRGIFINQAKYALEILKKHGMDKCDSVGTPMATKPKLDADLSRKLVDQTNYRSMIGSLMYLTSSRPDIVQAVCYCVRYQARPTEKHLKEVKRIFRYLKGTTNMGLWYLKDFGFELTAFLDADHVGCLDTRKNTSGSIQFLGDKLVSWMSKKQICTTMSSAKAEYVALSISCAQVMWMRTHLKDYGFNYNKIPLYYDSQTTIAILCNPVQHSRTKHIHTRYHFIKEQVEHGIVELYFVRTEYQLAFMFTKALPEDRFRYLVIRIVMNGNPSRVNHKQLCGRYKRRCCSLIPAESDSLPHAHAQTTKTYYKHQDLRIKKAQELKTKTFVNSDIKDPSSETKLRERLLESFQEDAKYEHVGQDTRSQYGKDDKDIQGKYLKISELKTKSKDNDKGSRSKITQHEGTSLQQNKVQEQDSSTQRQVNLKDLASGKIVRLKMTSLT